METETINLESEAKLAKLGDEIAKAQQARHAREQAERAAKHKAELAKNRLAKIEPKITELERSIAERQPIVDKLEAMFEEQRSKLAAMLNDRDAVPFNLVPEYEASRHYLDEIDKALTQALHTGAELILGVAASQVGDGVTYGEKRVRQPHALLHELAPDVNWTFPVAPMERELDELRKERDRLRKRLDK